MILDFHRRAPFDENQVWGLYETFFCIFLTIFEGDIFVCSSLKANAMGFYLT